MAREMKDSGIMWFPYIPQNWFIKKLNHICTVITDYVASGSFADLAANVEYLDEPNYAMLIRTTDISDKGHNSKPVYISEKSYQFLSNSNLFGGEILLPNIGASVGDVYIVPRLYEKMSLAPNSIMLKTEYVDKYFYYFFFCDAGRKSLLNIAKSTAQPKFNKTDLRQLRVIVPPLDEQHRIADFLDRKCAEIDRVLEKTRASIEEYKKLKQSVITQAVTKGIRGEREMRDSGIEWIGEIPSEWKTSRIKYISDFEPYCKTEHLSTDSIITYTPMEYIKNGKFIPNSAPYGSLSSSLTSYQEGDIVMAKVTPCFENGNIAIMNNLSSGYGLGSSELFVFRPKSVHTPYLFYWLQNSCFVQKACSTMIGTGGLKRISSSFVKNSPLTMPPEDEQIEITNYLDCKCAKIDTLISKKEQLITELEAYKKSLIYEYVTGKKEVQ